MAAATAALLLLSLALLPPLGSGWEFDTLMDCLGKRAPGMVKGLQGTSMASRLEEILDSGEPVTVFAPLALSAADLSADPDRVRLHVASGYLTAETLRDMPEGQQLETLGSTPVVKLSRAGDPSVTIAVADQSGGTSNVVSSASLVAAAVCESDGFLVHTVDALLQARRGAE